MGDRIGVGIIGIQGFGKSYLEELKRLPDIEIAAVCDLNERAAAELAGKYGISRVTPDYRELLHMPEVDALFIATPHFLHHTMTMEALQAGKHVFCEKPLAIASEDAREMAETARRCKRVLTCHYNRRQTTPVKLLRDLVAKGVLGEVYQANVKWMARWTGFMFDSVSSWRVSKEKAGGGILIGRGSHMLDAVWYILGKPGIRSVYATTLSKLTGFAVDDYAMAVLRLENGAAVHLECSYEANIPAYGQKIEYELFGTKAGALCAQVDGSELIRIGYNKFPEDAWVDLTDTLDMESYRRMPPGTIVEDFVDAVRTGRDPLVTAEDAAFVTELLEAAYQSSATGKEVVLQRSRPFPTETVRKP